MKRSSLATGVLCFIMGACGGETRRTDDLTGGPGSGAPGGGGGEGGVSTGADAGGPGGNGSSSATGCDKMDIVFVIDNSGSMSEEQSNLAQNFPRFIEVLNAFGGGNLDYRVAVTTTSFPSSFFGIQFGTGEQGAFLKANGMQRPWLERNDPDVSATFTQLATVGVGGSGQEQPLQAASSSVTARVDDGSNKDFLRSDALLAVVILTDEDDQSSDGSQMGPGGLPFPIPGGNVAPVGDFIAKFDAVAGDRKRWATAVIAGDQQPLCTSQFGDAQFAERLTQFVSETGANAVFSSICDGDLSKSLEEALRTFTVACDDFVVI